MDRPTKITFADMREAGVRGLLIYCADYRCSHSIVLSGDPWPDDMRPRFICRACGKRRRLWPNFDWDKPGGLGGY